ALWRSGTPQDKGTIRFNHQVHLAPEGVLELAPDQAATGRSLNRTKLSCDDCHQFGSAGRVMLPIRYEPHCLRCHPLYVQVDGNIADEKSRRALEEFFKEPAPHPAKKETALKVRAALRQRFTEFVQQHPGVLAPAPSAEVTRSIPMGRRGQPVNKEQFAWVDEQFQQAERVLFDGKDGCA